MGRGGMSRGWEVMWLEPRKKRHVMGVTWEENVGGRGKGSRGGGPLRSPYGSL